MRIIDVTAIPLHTTETSLGAGPGACLVEVKTDEGITGIGEACTQSEHDEASLATQVIVERGLKPLLFGEDPLNIRKLWDKMYYQTEWFGRGGITMYGISAVDLALWDLLGKKLNISVSRLLGGRFREKVRVYASVLFNMNDFGATSDEAKKWVQEGYTAVKFGWGQTREAAYGLDASKDEAAVKHLREELGSDIDIMVDVGRNVNWSSYHALAMARRLSKYNIYWFEEPLPQDDIEGYIHLTSLSPVRIAAGEGEYSRFGFKRLLQSRAVDLIQPDISRAGGLTEGMRIADMAQHWNTELVPHGFSTAVNVAANLQWVAAMPDAKLVEFRRTKSPLMEKLVKKPFEVDGGYMKIPDRPGLGIDLDEKTVEEQRVKA